MNRIAAADFAKYIFDLLLIRYIATVPLCRAALLADGCSRLFGIRLIEFDNVDRGPLLGKAESDCLPYAAGPASDDRDFTVETKKRRIVAVRIQSETPRFQGIKSS